MDAENLHIEPAEPGTDLTRQSVPKEFCRVRSWLALYIVFWTLWGGVWFWRSSPGVTYNAGWISFFLAAQVALWVLALFAWTRVKIFGFWFVAGYAHLALGAHLVRFVLAVHGQRSLQSVPLALWPLLLLFAIVTATWSRDLLVFFQRYDGHCPLCKSGSVREPQLGRNWRCPHCERTLVWMPASESITRIVHE